MNITFQLYRMSTADFKLTDNNDDDVHSLLLMMVSMKRSSIGLFPQYFANERINGF